MSDLKFSCPHCQQHIQADSGYAGIQIACPSCQGGLVVPGTATPSLPPPPPPPPVSATPRLQTQTQAARQTAPASSATSGCPSCGNALPHGAVLCINCGFNLTTGKRMVAGQAVAPGRPRAAEWETPWYKTAFPYVGVFVLLLGVLYLLGRENPAFMLAFVGLGLAYAAIMHIVVLVAAFRESVGTGFLTLCIPIYGLWFVFKTNDSDTLKILYGVAIVVNLVMRLIALKYE